MNKMYVLALLSLGFGSASLAVSKSDLEKFEKAIASSKIDKVRSLLMTYESKNLSAQERKTFLEQLARIASDVVTDRKEKLSLKGNVKDILTYADREKARDISLIGIGGLMVALCCWYGKDTFESYSKGARGVNQSEYYADLTFMGGIATLGISFGSYLAYKGSMCEMQRNALKAAEQIETFLFEQAGIKTRVS